MLRCTDCHDQRTNVTRPVLSEGPRTGASNGDLSQPTTDMEQDLHLPRVSVVRAYCCFIMFEGLQGTALYRSHNN